MPDTKRVQVAGGHFEFFESANQIVGEWKTFVEYVDAALSHYERSVAMPKVRDRLWLEGITHPDEEAAPARDVHDVDRAR